MINDRIDPTRGRDMGWGVLRCDVTTRDDMTQHNTLDPPSMSRWMEESYQGFLWRVMACHVHTASAVDHVQQGTSLQQKRAFLTFSTVTISSDASGGYFFHDSSSKINYTGLESSDGVDGGYTRCGAVRCGAVRCGAVRCVAVRWPSSPGFVPA